MTKIARPIQGRRAKPATSAFIKPSLNRGIAVIGTSGLVFGLSIAGSSFAYALPEVCSGQTITPSGTPTQQALAIESALVDDLVCLDGVFEIDQSIAFLGSEVIIGSDGTSITTAVGMNNSVFETTDTSASITIENLDIFSNGRVVRAYHVEIKDSVFTKSGLVSIDNGGAIFGEDWSGLDGSVVITNSTLSNYDASNGGAIYAEGTLSITDSTLSNNTADEDGGAIYSEGTLSITNSTLSNNDSSNGGAIYAEGTVEISNSTLSNNDAGAGGAILSEGQVTITASTLSNNSADEGAGAIFSVVDISVQNSIFSDNAAIGPGGAIYSAGQVDVNNSEFIGNAAGTTGGAISAEGSITISNSTLSENTADDAGGAIHASATGSISNSTLSGNTAGTNGGAIYAEGPGGTVTGISNSTLSNNSADENGGAIYGFGILLNVTNSTFSDNSASNGGAMHSEYDWLDLIGGVVAINNSTFVDNRATNAAGEGGAIFAHGGEVLFSTFVNNEAPAPTGGDTPGNAIYKTGVGELEIGANIFSGDSDFPQLGIGAAPTRFSDIGGNVFSTLETAETAEIGEISMSTLFGKSLSLLFGTSSPVLATYAPNTSNTQTIGLAAGSPALGIVPDTAPFNTYALDQRGAVRIDPRDAGAFQGVKPAGGDSSAGGGSSADFAVFSLPTGITKPGSEVNVSGANLNLVKEVYVSGVKVKIKKQSAATLVFTAPRGLTGVVDVRFVSAASQYNAFRGLDFGSSAVSATKARTVVGGFAANSTRLSMKMKREIRAFLKANSGFSSVTCMGFTSEPATALDTALAKARGQVTCNYIKKLDPDLEVKVVQGRHTELPGSKIRRVRITME